MMGPAISSIIHHPKNDSGNRRQGGGGWGTPLKKRSVTRIKFSKDQLNRLSSPPALSHCGAYSAPSSPHPPSVHSRDLICEKYVFSKTPCDVGRKCGAPSSIFLKEIYSWRSILSKPSSINVVF